MTVETNQIDGNSTFDGGSNEGVIEALIPATQSRKNINVTIRNHAISPRPKYVLQDFKFLPDSIRNKSVVPGALTYEQNFLLGRIQHVGKFQTSLAEYLILVRNGVIYAVDLQLHVIRVVSVDGDHKLLNYNLTRINGTQAHRYYVINDYPSQPVYIDNEFNAKRSKFSNQEIPRSYISTYVHNRLFIGSGISFGASDPVGTQNPLAPITFKESIVGAGNVSPAFPDQFFSLSYIERLSAITAMGYFRQTEGTSALGFGPLFISTKEAIHMFPVNNPRDTWSKGQFGHAYIFNYGIVGQNAFTNVGADVWYRSWDGHVYSTSTLYSDQRRWGNTNISNEIEESLVSRNKHLLKYASMGYLDNRIFTTLKPCIVKARNLFGREIEDYVGNGLGVLELNSASGVTAGSSNPIWSGIFSGLFSHILEINNEMICVGKSFGDGETNIIFKLDNKRTSDLLGPLPSRVRSRIYTREYVFKSALQDKLIKYVQLDIRNIIGKLTANVYYRIAPVCCWTYFGSIYYTPKTCFERGSTQNEFISSADPIEGNFKGIEFKIDIEGEDYDFVRLYAVADILADLAVRRDMDDPGENKSDFCQVEDYAL